MKNGGLVSLEAGKHLAERLEAERLRVARELHDGPIQELIGIGFSIAELKRELNRLDSVEILGKLEKIQNDSLQVARLLRGVVSELRPAGLLEFGVAQAVVGLATKLIRDFPERAPELILDCEELPDLTLASQLCLFRCTQEALNNALRHAGAERLSVELRQLEHCVELVVKDDGVGFEVPSGFEEFVRAEHFGLAGMAERVAIVSGHLHIDSCSGGGSVVRVTVATEHVCES